MDAVEPDDLVQLTADIVSAYVSNNKVGSAELGKLIEDVHGRCKRAPNGPAAPEPGAAGAGGADPQVGHAGLHRLAGGRTEVQVAEAAPAGTYGMTPDEYRVEVGPAARLSDGRAELCQGALRARQEHGSRPQGRRAGARRGTAAAPAKRGRRRRSRGEVAPQDRAGRTPRSRRSVPPLLPAHPVVPGAIVLRRQLGVERDLGALEELRDRAAGLRSLRRLLEILRRHARHAALRSSAMVLIVKPPPSCSIVTTALRAQLFRRMARPAQPEGERHVEAAGMRRREQLFRVGALLVAEAPAERIGRAGHHAALRRQLAAAGLDVAVPDRFALRLNEAMESPPTCLATASSASPLRSALSQTSTQPRIRRIDAPAMVTCSQRS